MNPSTVIQMAAAAGVTMAISPPGNLKVVGDEDAVEKWLPVIRENKPGIVAALQQAANDGAIPNPATEDRRLRVRATLDKHPDSRCAVVVDDPYADPVIVALAVRGQATCELRIPRKKYDAFLFLEFIQRHGTTKH